MLEEESRVERNTVARSLRPCRSVPNSIDTVINEHACVQYGNYSLVKPVALDRGTRAGASERPISRGISPQIDRETVRFFSEKYDWLRPDVSLMKLTRSTPLERSVTTFISHILTFGCFL